MYKVVLIKRNPILTFRVHYFGVGETFDSRYCTQKPPCTVRDEQAKLGAFAESGSNTEGRSGGTER